MAMRDLATLYPRVSPNVPNCPQPVMLQYLRNAAVAVCERTLAWRHTMPTFPLVPGVHEYVFDRPVDTQVHVLFGAIVNGVRLPPVTLEQALELYPRWADLYSGLTAAELWAETPPATFNATAFNTEEFNAGSAFVLPDAAVADGAAPRVVTQLTPEKFIVLPLPDAEDVYTARLFYALKPTRAATALDATVLDDLEDVIVHFALQQLLVMPNVAWADRELATYHAKQAMAGLGARRARANLGVGRGTLVAHAPRFA